MTQHEFTHILSLVDALSPEQVRQLYQELEGRLAAQNTGLTEEEAAEQETQRLLFESGLLSEIKPPRRLIPSHDQFTPISIEGEPLSETIIRERR